MPGAPFAMSPPSATSGAFGIWNGPSTVDGVDGATPSTVEGPFHIPNAPEVADGGDMAKGAPGIACFVTGKVRGLSGEPIGGAILDLWQTDGEGLYEEQRRTAEPWMR